MCVVQTFALMGITWASHGHHMGITWAQCTSESCSSTCRADGHPQERQSASSVAVTSSAGGGGVPLEEPGFRAREERAKGQVNSVKRLFGKGQGDHQGRPGPENPQARKPQDLGAKKL